MTATTKLGLELLANAAANQTLANTTFAQLNQLVQPAAVDRLATPPGSPANEALYIITATATGVWAGKENQLAYWLTSTGAWQYIVPREGFKVHVNDEDAYYKFNGSAWEIEASGGGAVDVQDDGSAVVSGADTLNFTGSGVTVTDVGGVATVNIPGGGGSVVGLPFRNITTTYAVTPSDAGKWLICDSASPITLTIGAEATSAWTTSGILPMFHVLQKGSGAVTITGDGFSVTVHAGDTNVTDGAGSAVTILWLAANTWQAIGRLVPV